MTLTKEPVFKDNSLLNFQPAIVNDLVIRYHKVQVSIFIKEGVWLNISMIPPQPNTVGLWFTAVTVLLLLLGGVVMVNYWAVKALNLPIQTLIQSLKYSEDSASWLPIPVTGNLDQKLIFEKINTLQAKLSQLLENRTQAVTAISHDLRTPLTRLKLRAEYLADSPLFDKIMQDINEMEEMIGETLDYFKDMNHEAKMGRFDLIAMLHSLVEDASDLNYDVSFVSDADKLIYVGNVNLLKRAFSNLINNAVYYGKQATISLRQLDSQIEIVIEDRGPGLEPEDLERVFMPFYRVENSRSRKTGGTGLGLTITREILEKHRGSIVLSNMPQGGLQVLITLPKVW
jgi:signal transduction histidine kinase